MTKYAPIAAIRRSNLQMSKSTKLHTFHFCSNRNTPLSAVCKSKQNKVTEWWSARSTATHIVLSLRSLISGIGDYCQVWPKFEMGTIQLPVCNVRGGGGSWGARSSPNGSPTAYPLPSFNYSMSLFQFPSIHLSDPGYNDIYCSRNIRFIEQQ